MSFSTVDQRELVLMHRLTTLNILPVVQPNKSAALQKPYLVPEHVPVSSRNMGLAPGGKVHTSILIVKVITDLDVFSKFANDFAQAVMDGFPFGLSLDCGTGKLRVYREPFADRPMRTDTSWSLPVSIHLMATAK